MGGPTVAEVSGWRTGPLLHAADRLTTAAREVEDEAAVVRRSLGDAVEVGGGAWATTAEGRAASEARTGLALADGLLAAARALRAGAADLAGTRDRLLGAVDRARAGGWPVAPDGQVSPRPLLETGAQAFDPAHAEAARLAEEERAAHESAVRGALAAATAADLALAMTLEDLPFPQTLGSLTAAQLARRRILGDPVTALGAAGGAVVAARTAWDGAGLVRKGGELHGYLRAAATAGASSSGATDRLRAFAFGGSGRNLAMRAGGKAFLPLTILGGARDAYDGGGHDGARGWATRGFGAAGAVGGATVLAVATTSLTIPVVGLGIAGAAVLAYGAWSTGSYLVDHWDQVEHLAGEVGLWSAERAVAGAEGLDSAVDWAQGQLADVGAGALDALDELF